MTPVLKTLLVLLGLLALVAEPVLGQRRRRDRRRRRRRRRKVKCTEASAYSANITSMKKAVTTNLGTITAEDDEEAVDTCFLKCSESGQSMQYFVVTVPESGNAYECSCAKGKLKKVKNSQFKILTGPLDLESGQLLAKKGKKFITNYEDCNTEPVAKETEKPSPSPTRIPSAQPSVAPTFAPTMIYEEERLFEVNAGGKVDASDLWNGKEAATGKNFRSGKIDSSLASYQALYVSVVKGDTEVAYYELANAPSDGKMGWFSFKNLAGTNYDDLRSGGAPEFFKLPAWDEAIEVRHIGQMNWSGENIVMGASFSEENTGWSEWKAEPMVGMKCSGGHCDNKQLRWTTKFGGIVNNDPKLVRRISEENDHGKGQYNEARCPANKIVCKIWCSGDNCDNMDVHCCTLKDGWTVTSDAALSGWFSEENGGTKDCGGDRYVTGVKCSGSYCDNVELWCSKMTKRFDSVGRDFYITKGHGGCNVDNGWLTLDSGKDDNRWDPCSWEGNGQGPTAIGEAEFRIYYAPDNKLANPYEGKAQLADSMSIHGLTFKYGYIPVYKLGTGTQAQFNFYEQFTSGGAINMDAEIDLSDPNTGFRHTALDVFMKRDWYGIVKVDLYKDGEVAKSIEFLSNPGDARTNGWMTQSNILSSDWAGVKPGMTSNYFSVAGDADGNRRMFIQHNYDGCDKDSGWLVVQTMRRQSMCPWEAEGKQPMIYFAPGDDNVKWQTAGAFATADSMVISISFDIAISYERLVKGCVNGNNIGAKIPNQTVAQCADLCDLNDSCKAFEYGVNYGGAGGYRAYDCQLQSSADPNGCDGAHHNLDLYVPA